MDPTTYRTRVSTDGFAVVERPSHEVVEVLPTQKQADAYAERLNAWSRTCDELTFQLRAMVSARPQPNAPEEEALLEAVQRHSHEEAWLLAIVDRIYEPDARLDELSFQLAGMFRP